MTHGTLNRKIYFYWADAGEDESQVPLTFDARRALGVIEGLSTDHLSPNGRYLRSDPSNGVCAWPDLTGRYPRAMFARIRWSDWPLVDRDGKLSALRIRQGGGLAEATHVVFFPGGVVGADYNHFGPRMSRVAAYLELKVGQAIEFLPLLRPDARRQLADLEQFRELTFEIRASFRSRVREIDETLGRAFEVLEGGSGADVLSVNLKLERRNRGGLKARFARTLRRLAGMEDLEGNANKFRIKGPSRVTDRIEEVDLLRSKLLAKKDIVRMDGPSRAVVPEDAYRAIEEAFDELKPEIEEAEVLA